MSEFNDKELFETAISDAPVETVEAPLEQAVQTNDTPRDEKGRFAPKEQAPEPVAEAPAPEQPVAAKEEAHVPSWRLREVNDAREAAERRARDVEDRLREMERQFQQQKQQQKPQEPVDFFTDPNAALAERLSPFEQRMQQMQQSLTLRASRAEAVASYGKDTVAEMEKAIEEAMRSRHPEIGTLRAQMLNSDDPVGVAMQWHQREKLLKETGGDLSAYKNKTLEDALKNPEFLAKALEAARAQAGGAPQNTVVKLPPSINRATSAASAHEHSGDLSSESLYAFATR